MLIDGGGYRTDRFDTGEQLIAPFLWYLRLWRLDTMVITHPHGDHFNGLPFLLERFRPRRLIINGDPGEEQEYGELLQLAQRLNIPCQQATAGRVLAQGEGFAVHCLGMPGLQESPARTTNDRSLVISYHHNGQGLLFPADLGVNSEQMLINSGADLRAKILLAPHHGSPGSASAPFIRAVNPALIVVSAGRQRKGVLPSPQHLDAWQQQRRLPLVTAQVGTITCISDGLGLRVTTFAGPAYTYNQASNTFTDMKCRLQECSNRFILGGSCNPL